MSERRFNALSNGETGEVSGYCILWDSPSFIESLGRVESFKKGSLKIPASGVSLDYQHDKTRLLGHSRKSLKIEEDDIGLKFTCKLPDSASDIKEAVKRQDIGGSSIEFVCQKDSIENGQRKISSALLNSISLVGSPAHKTSLSYRSQDIKRKRIKWSQCLWSYPA